jgi:hypothetical protein
MIKRKRERGEGMGNWVTSMRDRIMGCDDLSGIDSKAVSHASSPF